MINLKSAISLGAASFVTMQIAAQKSTPFKQATQHYSDPYG